MTRPRVAPPGTVRDLSTVNTLPWTELTEGSYAISVLVEDGSSGSSAQTTVLHQFVSRVTGGSPVVSATAHPLVALYSTPSCTSGTVQVIFYPVSGV